MKRRMFPAVSAAFAVVVVAVAGAGAQRGAPQGEGGRGAAPAQKPYVPVGTTAISKNPDQFLGEPVTLTASVDAVLSKSTFSIDQRVKNAPAGTPLLVIAPILNGPVEANTYVTVAGELVKFEPAQIAKKAETLTKVKGYQIDLAPA